jgi:DNA-binding CsgD family transcriptional regulator
LFGISASLMGVGLLAALKRRYGDAIALLGVARRIDESIGVDYNNADAAVVERCLTLCAEGMGQDAFERERAAAGALQTEAAIRLAEEYPGASGGRGLIQPAAERTPRGLTRQEAEVLRQLASGRTNREIAAALFLSVRTVENHIANAYGKIDRARPCRSDRVGHRATAWFPLRSEY